MAANRRLATEWYAPLGQQTTEEIYHRNVGNPKSPDHTLASPAYPDRRVRSIVSGAIPMWTTQYVNGGQRFITQYRVPTGVIYTNHGVAQPQSQETFTLPRRMYIFGGKLVTE